MNKSHVSAAPQPKQLGSDNDDEQTLQEKKYYSQSEISLRNTKLNAPRRENM